MNYPTGQFVIYEESVESTCPNSVRNTISPERHLTSQGRINQTGRISYLDRQHLDTNLDFHDLPPLPENAHTFEDRASIYTKDYSDEDDTLYGSPVKAGHKITRSNSSSTEATYYTQDMPQKTYELPQQQQPAPTIDNNLVQGLHPHNVAFITLCSVFGTGLFITTTTILQVAGPIPMFFGFLITGLIAYQVMTALCDMVTYTPLPDNFAGFVERFVDPALGFCTSYTFLGTYLLFGPNQISAATLAMSFWVDPERISPALWVIIFISLIAIINYCKITKYAYTVDFFILLKMLIYMIIAITLIVVIAGGSPKGEVIGFKYWENPGVWASYPNIEGFGSKMVAFCIGTTKTIWSYVGIESFSVAAIETVNPRYSIPRAKKIIFWMVLPTYLTLAFLIGLSVSYNNRSLVETDNFAGNARASVMFVAFYNCNLQLMGHFINAALLVFIFSAANTGFYLSTRILYGLSASGIAPGCFTKTLDRNGIPIFCFLLVLAFDLLAFINVKESSYKVYHHFVDATSLFSLLNWACILLTHIRFLKAFKKQNLVHELKKYVPDSTTCVIPSMVALATTILLILANNLSVYVDYGLTKEFRVSEFLAGFMAIPIFVLLYIGFKLYYRTKFVALEEVDLFFYRDVVDQQEMAYLKHKAHREAQNGFTMIEKIKKRLSVLPV